MNWEGCKRGGLVKKVNPDKNLIKSLIKQSNRKLITDNFSPLNQDTASTKVSNNYDALREILEALAINNGLKIYNHECFSCFLKDVIKLEKESYEFDKFRKIRNSINYYGADLQQNEAEKLIIDINILRNKLMVNLHLGGSK